MSVTVLIPSALRAYAEGQSQVVVEAATAGQALAQLALRHAGLKQHLFNEQGQLRSFINVFVRDEDIRHLQGADTPLGAGEELTVVPSIAGGSPAAELPELDRDELVRYSRHLILPEVGLEGQRKLKQARVLLVGTGGLGAPLGLYLAAAGVGTLGIVDFDTVDASNLQRQVIHGTRDVGRPKIASATDRLRDLNPHVVIRPYETRLTSENALEIIQDYDVVVDGTDNFPTRYLVNDACVLLGKPNVYGSIFRFEGQASVFATREGACYRCLYPEPPPPGLVPSCAEGGVLGVLPGIIGCIQANETLKLILGGGRTLVNRLLLFDAWEMRFKELKVRKDPNCPICGEHPSIHQLVDYEQFCGLPGAGQASPEEITPLELKRRIDLGQDLRLLDVREPYEYDIAHLPNSTLIPLGQVAGRLGELDPGRETVVLCKMGGRSAKAIVALKAAGYAGPLINLQGGILAWGAQVDPGLPRY
jgi:adenylyltransferase/sulfurtransferase